jgi:muramidase (phage lysozyme)
MPRITAVQAGSQNRCAFLDMLATSEGTSTDPVTQDDGYDVLVTGVNGPARFDSYATHPDILVVVNSAGLESTAAGRYQELHENWVVYHPQLNLPDFGPISQDLMALQQIRETGALPYIDMGCIAKAIALCSHLWASLPGNNYGQHQNHEDTLIATYQGFGGTLDTSGDCGT